MKNMTSVILLVMVVAVGCNTPIKDTLETAQTECNLMKATIKNVDGLESVTIRCTWEQPLETW